ncbi:hypothetical protein IQ266_04110 [filamentous cyanobacterium LEGE 11480]|uniref:Uncharacterized protein n=1 Tax=Romeriopsis navalis LEGE 11480 TaxID=2777977 RepID=A0A928VLR0_9CYAN|nr:hypothetical protein [Romeriopsis navalis]MBE9028946.1 hypothetical protein [Romeriopsis navalis LEGE 11480]
MQKPNLRIVHWGLCLTTITSLSIGPQGLALAQSIEELPTDVALTAQEEQLKAAEEKLQKAQEKLEAAQEKLRVQQERLELQNGNFQLQETELQLKKRLNNLEQKQLGISDTTKPIGFGGIQAGTSFQQLPEVPIESKILVFKSSGEVAQLIAHDVEQVAKDATIASLVVYSQREFAKVNGYRLYNSMRKGIVSGYEDLGVELPQATGDGGSRSVGLGDVLPTSTTVLKSVAELFSYFRSEDKIALNSFTPQGENFVVAQLVSELRRRKSKIKVYAPSVYLMDFSRSNGVFESFLADLNELAALQAAATKQLGNTSDPQKRQRLEALNGQANLLLNLLKDTSFQDSEDKESEGARSGSQIFQLIKGAEINQLLNSRKKRVLVLDVLASGGSTRTRRSLFTSMFSGQRVSYSGGIAVQYFLVNPDNSFAAGDVIYRNSGFKTMRGATQSRRR